MAGGPIFPSSMVPVTATRIFPNIYVGAGANAQREEGMGVEASLGANATWHLIFQMPPTSLPTGTCKLRLLALASATSGNAQVTPSWASCAVEEQASGLTLTSEGTTAVSWVAGDSGQYKETKITLDADTPVAGEMIVMQLQFTTTSWTLAAISTWVASVIWE